MKKITAFIAFIMIAVVAITTVSSQGQDVILQPGESFLQCWDGSRPFYYITDTDIVICPDEEPTETPILPTETPLPPIETPPPPTPTGEGPRDGVPSCESHNPAAWHEVYNAELDCHYDHHHGKDPNDPAIVALLGNPTEYTGQEISYPWETEEESALKHRAYFWITQINEPCLRPGYADLCVKAVRAQLHADMGIIGFNSLTHSFWIEILACDDEDNCGIAKFGGWVDTGFSYSPYFGECVDVPANPGPIETCPEFRNGNPYRALPDLNEFLSATNPEAQFGGIAKVLWRGDGYNHNFFYVFRTLDAWSYLVDGADWTSWQYFCEDFQCKFNGSLINLNDFQFIYPVESSESFTDKRGNIDNECVEASFDCVPFVLDNWPGGNAVYARANGFPGLHPQDPAGYYEFDQSPASIGTGDEWWIVPTNYDYPP